MELIQLDRVTEDQYSDETRIRHCTCTICNPDPTQPHRAMCGAPKKGWSLAESPAEVTRCIVCLDLWRKPCEKCGM